MLPGWTAEDYAMIAGNEQLALELRVPQDTSSHLITEAEPDETDEPINNNDDLPQVSSQHLLSLLKLFVSSSNSYMISHYLMKLFNIAVSLLISVFPYLCF